MRKTLSAYKLNKYENPVTCKINFFLFGFLCHAPKPTHTHTHTNLHTKHEWLLNLGIIIPIKKRCLSSIICMIRDRKMSVYA